MIFFYVDERLEFAQLRRRCHQLVYQMPPRMGTTCTRQNGLAPKRRLCVFPVKQIDAMINFLDAVSGADFMLYQPTGENSLVRLLSESKDLLFRAKQEIAAKQLDKTIADRLKRSPMNLKTFFFLVANIFITFSQTKNSRDLLVFLIFCPI